MWATLVEDLIWNLTRKGFHYLKYVDALTIIVRGHFLKFLAERKQTALNVVDNYDTESVVSQCSETTTCHATRKRILEGLPPIVLGDERIPYVKQEKYFAVWFDLRLTWSIHI